MRNMSSKMLACLFAVSLCVPVYCSESEPSKFSERLLARALTSVPSSAVEAVTLAFEGMQAYERSALVESEERLEQLAESLTEDSKEEFARAFLDGVKASIAKRDFATRSDLSDLESTYNNFLRTLFVLFPDKPLKEYFYDEPKTDRSIFSLKAWASIAARQAAQSGHGEGTPLVFLTYSEIGDYIDKLAQAPARDGVKYHYVMMRHTIAPQEPHISPILIRVNRTNLDILITDTLGVPFDQKTYKQEYKEHVWHFVELIAQTVNSRGNSKRHLSLYTQKQRRQFDMYSCGVFSFDDLLAYMDSDLFGFVDQLRQIGLVHELSDEQRILPGKNLKFFVFDVLPPRLMRGIQSSGQLSQYSKAVAGLEQVVHCGDVEHLMAHCAKHTLTLKDGKVNYYARAKFYEYADWLIKKILALPLAEVSV